MSRKPGELSLKVLINHSRWLQEQGPSYKLQAASCKRQAASLTRRLYKDILQYKGERHVKKRSKKNNWRTVQAI